MFKKYSFILISASYSSLPECKCLTSKEHLYVYAKKTCVGLSIPIKGLATVNSIARDLILGPPNLSGVTYN